MARRLHRRQLLQLGTAGTLGYLFTGPAFSVPRAFGANDKVRIAGIGVGGKGSSDIDQASQFMEVVALCDIDDNRCGDKGKKFPQAKKFFDYRRLFDEMAKEFDACTVSTADHSHALASVMAMRAGKHVYTQKPLTHTPFEARVMRETAAKQKVCTQMGNQGSALNGLRRAVELIHSGVLGQVTEAHVWTNRPAHYWKQSPDIVARPKEATAVPSYVHWDEWIGPAPMRPYALSEIQKGRPVYHPHDWRGWWDFGTGAMGDMACHTANMAFRALNLKTPTTVWAESAVLNSETYPAWAHMVFSFSSRGHQGPCTLHWYEGSKDGKKVLPPQELFEKVLKPGEKIVDSGSMLVGEKGILFSPSDYAAEFRLTPEKDFAGIQLKHPEKHAMGTDKDNDLFQKQEWFEAIKAGKPELAASNFDFAGQLTETMLLGNIAVRAGHGEKLQWNAEKMEFTNSPAATKFVTKEYRKGWDWLKG
ncbi:Gfo/Idh/MocA family protein [Limnoglobus roseus]|uniref:Putative Rossmann-fold-type glycoside hydrolase n=1 Tax=Limnoglobus roseus TaxID=2598579 RepID=A0A5C1ABT7_9BACT|nr:Gfo/Idh/MocA family oxidoreductase [Limnoglobus roseus]QEL14614.1 putative Rossmann-fold-type glycoside hydrolase [Limnoglobus roseus]